MTRHNLQLVTAAFAVLLGIASTAFAGVPRMDVTLLDGNDKVIFKGATNTDGTFTTASVQPGRYVVQLSTKSAAVKGGQYLVVVSAGMKKVVATGIAGQIFMGGGAAMKVNVGASLKITGQIANEEIVGSEGGVNYKVVGGQRFVWVTSELGSNVAGRWIEEGLAPGRNITLMKTEGIKKIQEKGGEGSMAVWDRHR